VADVLGCLIHNYVLMTNHVHLLVTPKTVDAINLLFQIISRHLLPYINKKYQRRGNQRRGNLWEGRHKGNILESEAYFLTCMRYIEMNPVRAGMAGHPAMYRWSSYATND
jgi:REP-associated tyrosine transposase